MAKKKKKQVQNELLGKRARGIDKILVFRFFKLLHGRFWGLGAIFSVLVGAIIGYAIRPDLFAVDIPLSRLGTDIRTAPFFAGSMFFAAYSLWRWRIYLSRTMKNTKPVLPLISLTILGLYMIALMPVTWLVWPSRLHHVGVFITGCSMLATVVFDSILSKNRKSSHANKWWLIKMFSVFMIIFGGILVLLSADDIAILNVILLGEAIMFVGYSGWIILKIYLGEGKRSAIGRLYEKIIS